MPLNVLLDNCIWLRLISKVEVSADLLQLEWLVQEKYITLLVPEVLQREWESHRDEQRKILMNAGKEYRMNARKGRAAADPIASLQDEYADELE